MREEHEFHPLGLEVLRKRLVDAVDDLLDAENPPLNAGLGVGVVVLRWQKVAGQ